MEASNLRCLCCGIKAIGVCGKCEEAPYCSPECQEKDWRKIHKAECCGAGYPVTMTSCEGVGAMYQKRIVPINWQRVKATLVDPVEKGEIVTRPYRGGRYPADIRKLWFSGINLHIIEGYYGNPNPNIREYDVGKQVVVFFAKPGEKRASIADNFSIAIALRADEMATEAYRLAGMQKPTYTGKIPEFPKVPVHKLGDQFPSPPCEGEQS
jgi:hypothetical protein